MVNSNGSENHNHVKFTSCRQFSGESVITFGDAPESKPDAAPIPTREFDLPDGLEIQLVLTQQIDLHKAAIGDPVRARVDHDVKKNGEVVIPKGAMASGRITRLEKYDTYSIIGVEFPEIEAPGIVARMKGRLDRTLGIMPPFIPATRCVGGLRFSRAKACSRWVIRNFTCPRAVSCSGEPK